MLCQLAHVLPCLLQCEVHAADVAWFVTPAVFFLGRIIAKKHNHCGLVIFYGLSW